MNNLGFGLGLRSEHKQEIIDTKPKAVDWFEIISENYFQLDSSACRQLEKIRRDYPFVMHGVSLSIGSTDLLDTTYLKKLKALEEWLQPELVSDHICWTGFQNYNTHDLLPVPYTEEALDNMVEKVQQVQDFLGRKIALENPSTYLEFDASSIPEWEFINFLLEQADCNLLLDINNLYVNCFNHNYDCYHYINSLPADKIVQIHMAGHQNNGTHIIDTHNSPIVPEVLDLYQYTIQRIGERSSMIEWDADIPTLPVLLAELDKLRKVVDSTAQTNKSLVTKSSIKQTRLNKKIPQSLSTLYGTMQGAIHQPEDLDDLEWIKKGKKAVPSNQIDIYKTAYRQRLLNAIKECYPLTEKSLGHKKSSELILLFIEKKPSTHYDINQYIFEFPKYAKELLDEFFYELLHLEREIIQISTFTPQEGTPLEALQQLSPEDLFSAKVSLLPFTSLLSFHNDIYQFYKDYKAEDSTCPNIKDYVNKPCFVIVRKEIDGTVNIPISKEEFQFLQMLQNQDNFMSVLENCLENHGLLLEDCIAILGKFVNQNMLVLSKNN